MKYAIDTMWLSEQESKQRWNEYKERVDIDKSWQGSELVMWLPLMNERYRDKICTISGEVREGSKVFKDQKAVETEDLKKFVAR
eukprot:2559355-Amphidinium_carterae.2